MKYKKLFSSILIAFVLSIPASIGTYTLVSAQRATFERTPQTQSASPTKDSTNKSKAPDTSRIGKKSLQQLVADIIVVTSGYIIRLLVALSVFVFLYGIMVYMFKGQGSDTARTEGRKLMMWGIIGLFVISAVWGLVAIVASLVGNTDIGTPQFK